MRLILCGGGVFEQNEMADKLLNDIIDNNKPILYCPLAEDEPYDKYYETIKKELKDVSCSDIDMVTTFEEFYNKNYYDYAAIYIGGGNTFKLLKGMKDLGAYEKLRDYVDNNGIVLGNCAGALIFCKDIDIIEPMDENFVNLKDTEGYNKLKDYSIFPHYFHYMTPEGEKRFIDHMKKYSIEKQKVIALPEEDFIYVTDDGFKVMGTREYFIVENGIFNEHMPFEVDNESK